MRRHTRRRTLSVLLAVVSAGRSAASATNTASRVLVPDDADRELVHRVIYDELCAGIARDSPRAKYRRIMSGLVERGARTILLGCTEIDLLVSDDDSPVPLFATTRLHATRAVDLALS